MVQWCKLISKMYGSFLVIIFLVLKVTPKGNAISFAYEREMETFLENQAHIIEIIRSRISRLSKEKQRCVGMYLKQNEVEHSKAMEETTTFLENPFNAYKLVKRFVDSQLIEKITSWKLNKIKRLETIQAAGKLLQNANAAILNLAVVYKLNVTELADGILRANFSITKQPLTDVFPPMISTDCLELSQAAYDYGDFELALAWGKEALRKQHESVSDDCFYNDKESMLYMSLIYNMTGDAVNSLYWLNKSKSEGASEKSLCDYENRIKQHINKFKENEERRQKMKLTQEQIKNPSYLRHAWYDSEGDLCCTERNQRRLYCEYQHGPHPFLRLARVKAELLYREPDVTMFHDVISDTEISVILELAQMLYMGPKDKTCEFDYENTSIMRTKTCLNDSLSRALKKVSERVQYMSGISLANLTKLTVIDYGVAGYQTVHYDANTINLVNYCTTRFDTFIFYLNAVKQGGATIFPKLNFSVYPVKNSALYFTNLLPSGQFDPKLQHAACPVLYGTKWVALKRLSSPNKF